jgi:hypothetical protein
MVCICAASSRRAAVSRWYGAGARLAGPHPVRPPPPALARRHSSKVDAGASKQPLGGSQATWPPDVGSASSVSGNGAAPKEKDLDVGAKLREVMRNVPQVSKAMARFLLELLRVRSCGFITTHRRLAASQRETRSEERGARSEEQGARSEQRRARAAELGVPCSTTRNADHFTYPSILLLRYPSYSVTPPTPLPSSHSHPSFLVCT